MARNHKPSRSSRSKSPSVSLDARPDDLEAQMSAIDSSNTGNKQEAVSVVSRMSSAHRASDDVSPNPLFDGAPSFGNIILGDLKAQSRTNVARSVNGGDPLQAANPTNIPLPPSVENLSQLGSNDGELASTGSAPNAAAEANEDTPLSGNASNRSNVIDGDGGSARNEQAASETRPRSLDVPPARQKNEGKSEPGGETSDPWTKCATAVWPYETNRVEKWKEDINNLLLFSGLFSTVLTGFIVQYYVMLSIQQPDASAQALVHISSQLAAMSGQLNAFMNGAVYLNVTQPIIPSAATLPPVPPTSHTTISTCTLWFMALVCSLGAASIGITVSQWLQHHGDKTTSTSRQSVRIWYFRDQGFVDWGVQDIINILPLLLQLSVALFLVGLVQLLFTMNVVVASIMTVLVATLLTFSMGTALVPAFAPKCPYKSSQGWWCLLIVHWLTKHFEHLPFVEQRFGEILEDPSSFLGPPIRYITSGYLLRHIWRSVGLPLDRANSREVH